VDVFASVQAGQVTLYILWEIIVHSGLPRKLNLAIYRLKASGYIIYILEAQVFGTQYVFRNRCKGIAIAVENAPKNKGGNGME
jgi:hypothetical protein